jgi:hypothetical protein
VYCLGNRFPDFSSLITKTTIEDTIRKKYKNIYICVYIYQYKARVLLVYEHHCNESADGEGIDEQIKRVIHRHKMRVGLCPLKKKDRKKTDKSGKHLERDSPYPRGNRFWMERVKLKKRIRIGRQV